MDEIKTKQQVVEKIKEASKILVTVSNSPSVDELSAALALTLLLDKQEKYATAIFSGETPPAIAFLEPEKTFDDTTDSLRDFIIALNKEKADHLRYKVVEDAVKIFITPYKTTIDETDLEFSQGDYNVELVVALGVNNQDHLDKALEDHGQILHDAAIITMTAGDQTSTLGGIDWHDSNSSSLSEMVAGLAEALKTDKKKPLLDAPIATALLTGIVAETDRFSNERTTSKAMTVAGTLMAAGADQQLIANELQASQEITSESAEEVENLEDEDIDSDAEIDKESDDGSLTIKKDRDDTALAIKHEGETLADLDRRVLGEEKAKEKVIEEIEHVEEQAAQAEAEEAAVAALKEATEASKAPEAPEPEQAPEVAPEVAPESTPEPDQAPATTPEPTVNDMVSNAYSSEEASQEPILGGTLNATTEQAADDARRAIENDQNRTILAHSYLGGGEASTPQTPGSVAVSEVPEANEPVAPESVHSAYAFDATPAPADAVSANPASIAFGGERVIQPLSDSVPAPEAVASAYAPADAPLGASVDVPTASEFQPFNPMLTPDAVPAPVEPVAAYGPSPFDAPASFTAPAPEPVPEPAPLPAPEQAPVEPQTAPGDFGLPLPPPLPDFSQMNGAPAPAIPLPEAPQPEILGDILAPDPQQESMVYEPQPPFAPQPEPQIAMQPESVQQASPADPGQFQIPTQQ